MEHVQTTKERYEYRFADKVEWLQSARAQFEQDNPDLEALRTAFSTELEPLTDLNPEDYSDAREFMAEQQKRSAEVLLNTFDGCRTDMTFIQRFMQDVAEVPKIIVFDAMRILEEHGKVRFNAKTNGYEFKNHFSEV